MRLFLDEGLLLVISQGVEQVMCAACYSGHVASLKETQACNIRLNLPYKPINSGS